jgi:hypothetical protein
VGPEKGSKGVIGGRAMEEKKDVAQEAMDTVQAIRNKLWVLRESFEAFSIEDYKVEPVLFGAGMVAMLEDMTGQLTDVHGMIEDVDRGRNK